jgi:hypothetical protein
MQDEIAETLAHYNNQSLNPHEQTKEARDMVQHIEDMVLCFLYGIQMCRLVSGPYGDPAGLQRHEAFASWELL